MNSEKEKYSFLEFNDYSFDNYAFLPLRYEDIFKIKKWRNDQISILRQNRILSDVDQENFYQELVKKSFFSSKPNEILFSFLLDDTGPTYESVSFLIPISVLGSMIWDIWKDKRSFYFHPVEKDEPYPRNMYVFSLKHITEAFILKTMRKIERTKIGRMFFGWFKKKYY